MARLIRAKIKKEVLVWARESAGFTPAEVAKRVGVPEKKLVDWEDGNSAPTVGQLQKLAEVYRRPVSVMYLQEVPKNFQPMHDFRRLPGTGLRRFSPELALEIRIANQRRQLALELLEESGEASPKFTARAEINENPEVVGARILSLLEVAEKDRAEWRIDPAGYAAFNSWRSRIEHSGVLVFQSTQISADEVSGFAVAEEVLPVIVVSRKESPPKRRTFSLLHEFAHLMLRASGVSDLDIVDASRPPEDQAIEVFCNQAAAAALMPKDSFLAEARIAAHGKGTTNWSNEEISEIALSYSVSREAVVRRLLTFSLTTTAFYRVKRAEYIDEYLRSRERNREKLKKPGEKFLRNPPRDAITNFGKPLVEMILGSYYHDRMTLSDVSGYLGIRTRHIPKLEHIVGLRNR